MPTSNRLLLVAPLLALAACVDNRATVELRSVCSLPDADDCSFDATCDATLMGPYFFDIGPNGSSMDLFIEVENQLPSNEDTGSGRVNTNDAFVEEVIVTYSGGVPLAEASHRLQQMVPAEGSSVLRIFVLPDSAVAELEAIDVADATVFAGIVDLVAAVRIRGIYGDGTEFETGTFEVPLRICEDCLFTIPPCPNVGDLVVTCPPGIVDSVAGGRPYQNTLSVACVTP